MTINYDPHWVLNYCGLVPTNRILVYNSNRTEKESKEENFRETDIGISNVFMGVFLLIQCRKTESTLFLEQKMKLNQRREVKIERKTTTLLVCKNSSVLANHKRPHLL